MELKEIADSFEPISSEMDATSLQESSAYRSLQRSKRIAEYLIDDEGALDLAKIDPVIVTLERLHPLLQNREMDAIFTSHQIAALKTLKEDKEVRRLFLLIDKPEGNKRADEMIQRAVGLESKASLTKAHARRAALSAYLTLLRQNVGSCFATAPALLIQQEKPYYLFKDLNDLFATGRLKRVVGGKEHVVPLSQSFGIGDLRRPLLLLASTDVPMQRFAASPGVIQAFSILKTNVLALLKQTFEAKLEAYTYLNLTVEDIFRQALLTHLGLTEKEIEEYTLRIKPHLPFGAIDWSGKEGNKCGLFFHLFEEMKNSFISLTDHPVLKAWEFTLASFCETQSDFAKWNLYSSLGLDSREPGGIGQVLYATISHYVDLSNQKMLSIQDEYKTAWLLLQGVETKVRNATSEQELRWIRADFMSKKNECNTLEELRDKESSRGQKLAHLFQFIIDQLILLFPTYFQEVYDPELKEVLSGPYDDAPCGFRLMYKHGRQNTSAWTFIRNYQEFIDTLTSFFNAFEVEFNRDPNIAGIEKEFTETITQMAVHIRSDDFINSAFHRMAIAHKTAPIKEPLKNLDKIAKKPWAYTSGGTMATLIANYFSREDKPAEASTWVESPQELLIFLEDLIKKMPYKEAEKFLEKRYASFLIHSPTHAFRFMPGLAPFHKIWQERQFTYTYVRDHYIEPTKKYYSLIRLDHDMLYAFLQEIRSKIPANFHASFDLIFRVLPRSLSPSEFYEFILKGFHQDRTLAPLLDHYFPKEEIEALLFANIPYIRPYDVEDKAKLFLKEASFPSRMLSSKEFFDLLLSEFSKLPSPPTRQQILDQMEQHGLRPPAPLLFADTNWQNDYFAFLVSPATLELEFWRLTPASLKGAPMSIWKNYLNGTVKSPNWGVYINKQNYS